ncbi:MAG TPA: PAS domain-containing protein [Caulobacteraceae bacterium]
MAEDPETERLRMAVDVAGLGLWRFDVVDRTLEWDARTKALYGLPPDAETTVETFQTGLHPDDRDSVIALLDEALKDRARDRFELEHRTVGPDGAVRWVLGHGRVVRDDTGRALALFGTSRDVTDRKEVELALAESERRFDLAARAHGIGVFDWSVKTGRLVWSEQEQRLFGLEPGAFGGTIEAWSARVHPDDLAVTRERLGDAMAAGDDTVDFAFRVVRPDGEVRQIEGSARILYDAAGEAEQMIGVNIDVTDRRRAEDALRDSEARLRTLSDNLPSAMIYQIAVPEDGLDRRFLYVSGRCEELNGVPASAVIEDAAALYGLIAPEERERVGAIEARCTVDLTPFDVECRFVLADGRSRWFRLISAPRRMPGGGTIWDGLQIDVTDQRQAEQRRRLLTDELNHRVKNTLAIVQALSVQTFREDTSSAEARARFESRLGALSTAHDLLTEENWEGASLQQVVQSALSGPFAPERADRLVIEGPDHRLTPKTAVSLAMALHELGANASKHGAWSGPEGRVRVGWTLAFVPDGRRIELRWEESGGPEVRPPSRRGFGSRLVGRGLAAELGGEVALDYAPAGVVCTISAVLRNEDLAAARS